MQLLFVVEFFDLGTMYSYNVTNLFYLGAVFHPASVEHAMQVLVGSCVLLATICVGCFIDYFQDAHVAIVFFCVEWEGCIHYHTIQVNLVVFRRIQL